MFLATDLERIVNLAHERGIYLLLDECYVYLNFTGKAVSGGSFVKAKEHVVVLGSLSKTYAMTGWRAGFALGPKPIIARHEQAAEPVNIVGYLHCAEGVDCRADEFAGMCCEMRAEYIKLRDQKLARLSEIPGVTCTVPEGAFYVYPNISAFLGKPGVASATELATRLLHEAHVVTVPGEAFGTRDHIRYRRTPSRTTTLKRD